MAFCPVGVGEAWRKASRWLLFTALALLVPMESRAAAADEETREFTVYVDGKPAGRASMKIQRRDDGTTAMTCDSRVVVRFLFIKYEYTYNGKEIWKDRRLQRFDSTCDDDGKKFVVSAAAEDGGLRIKVNNRERVARPEVWLTSYWCLPDPKLRDQTIPIIDADTGRDLDGKLQHVGAVQMRVAGEAQNVNHYRLTGKVDVDLWYDAAERIVRQEWIEDGHRTILELNKVRR
jgi:hypothetical protein